MRRNILFGAILALALILLCSVVTSCDSDAEDTTYAVHMERDGVDVGQAMAYGWSASVIYDSENYIISIDTTGAYGYEWRKDGVQVSTNRTCSITVKDVLKEGIEDVTYVAYMRESAGSQMEYAGEIQIHVSKRTYDLDINNQTITYGESIASTTDMVDIANLDENDHLDSVVLTQSISEPGTGTIEYSSLVIKDNNGNDVTCNYEANNVKNGVLTIDKKTYGMVISNQTITYGESIASTTDKVTITGLLTGHYLYSIVLTQSISDVGTGVISYSELVIKDGSGNAVTDNYEEGSCTAGVLKINKKDVTITAIDQTITYGGDISTTVEDVTVSGLLEGHVLKSIGFSTEPLTAGSHEITLSDDVMIKDSDEEPSTDVTGNYNVIRINGTVTVNKRALTITADDQTGEDAVVYGDPLDNTKYSVGTDQLLAGHTVENVTITPATWDVRKNIVITPSGATVMNGSEDVTDNYEISYVPGKLDISKRDVTLSIPSDPAVTSTYDGTAIHNIEVGTGVNDETLLIELEFSSTVPGTYVYTDEEVELKYWCTGEYGSGTGKLSNYNPTPAETMGNITITKRDIIVKAYDQTITYGSSIDTGLSQVSKDGIASGQDITAVTLTASRTDVGTGTITPSDIVIMDGSEVVTGYYNIDLQDGILTVKKKGLTITANNQTIDYGNSIVTGVEKVVVSGLVNGHKLDSITLEGDISDVGTGKVTPSDAVIKNGDETVTGNYQIAYIYGTLTVNKRSVTLNIDTTNTDYDGTVNRTIEVTVEETGETLKNDLIFTSSDVGVYVYKIGYIDTGWYSGTGKISNYDVATGETNYQYINSVGVSITISGETVYDSTEQRTMTFGTGVNNEKLKVTITFSSKDVGDYIPTDPENTYTVGSWADDPDTGGKTSNYSITPLCDTLTITEKEIVIDLLAVGPINFDNYTKTVDSYIDGVGGDRFVSTCTTHSSDCGLYEYIEGTETSSGKYIMTEWTTASGYTGKISNYDLKINNYGYLEIVKKDITIVAKDQNVSKYGDNIKEGIDQISYDTSKILAGHSLVSVVLTPSSLHAGDWTITPSDIVIKNGSDEDVTFNYNITYVDGDLHIGERTAYVTIPAGSKTYDGQDTKTILVNTDYNGETLKVDLILSSADVGTYSFGSSGNHYTLDEWENGTGLASDYNIVVTTYGDFTVNKKEIEMKIPTCSFTYNGQNVWASSSTTGVGDERFSLTLTTSSPNAGTYMYNWESASYTYSWSDGTGKLSNYTITKTTTDNGVIINKAEATVRAQDSKMYDGTVLNHDLVITEVIGLVSGDTFVSGNVRTVLKDCGTYTESIVTVVTQNGSNNYNFKQEVSLTIVQRDITITSGTLSAVEGMISGALVYETVVSVGGSGYVDGETLDYDFTGSQTTVGSSLNTFSCKDSSTALLGNYNVTYVFGTLKVISKNDVTTKAETDSNVLSEQIQADLTACAEYNRNIGKIQLVEITTTASDLSMSAEFIRDLTVDNSAPVSISTYYGRIILTKEFASSALSEASMFNVNIMNKEKSSDYALEYSVVLTADEKEIHSLGTSTKVTFFIDPTKVFPVNRTMKIVAVESGERYDAEYDGKTGELSFNTDHLSDYGVTMEDNVGGPSFTAVIVVIIVCAVLAIAAGVLIYHLKKNFYI